MISTRISKLSTFIVITILSYSAVAFPICQQAQMPAFDCFYVKNNENLIQMEDTRIFNGHVSVQPVSDDVFGFRDPFAPPYVFRDFVMEAFVDGKKIPTTMNLWNINDYDRGFANDIYYIKTTLTLAEDAPVLLFAGMFINASEATRTFQVGFSGSGNFGRGSPSDWRSPGLIPAVPLTGHYDEESKIYSLTNGYGGMYCYADLENPVYQKDVLKITFTLPPQRAKQMRFTCSIGEEYQAHWLLNRHKGPLTLVAAGVKSINTDFEGLFEKLPYIVSNEYRLRALYDRSILSLLDSRWEMVRDFMTMPQYVSGGMDEQHVDVSIDDFFRGSRFATLADPDGTKIILRNFIQMNPVRYGAYGPVTAAFSRRGGKWNYYRIVKIMYDYLSITGDYDFATERIGGKQIIDFLAEYADSGSETLEDPEIEYFTREELPPVGSVHPEYFGYVPNMNGQRVWMYRAVAEILDVVQEKQSLAIVFRNKADVLADKINNKMWNTNSNWYDTLDQNGNRKSIYDASVLEMINYGVMDAGQVAKLTDHINMDEFLGPFGLLGVSRSEKVEGVNDGVSVSLMPSVVEGMYRAGLNERANELLQKIYWWGEGFSYLPPVIAGNSRGYSREYGYTSIAGLSAAEAIAFGYFGLKAGLDGEVSISPPEKRLSYMTNLKGMIIRGHSVSVSMGVFNCEVKIDDNEVLKVPLGKRTVIITGTEYTDEEKLLPKHCYESGAVMIEARKKKNAADKVNIDANKLKD